MTAQAIHLSNWETLDSSLAALITSVAALIASVAAWRRAGRNGRPPP